MDVSKLKNEEKAAILLIALGEDIASEIIKGLEPKLAKKIARNIGSIKQIDDDTLDSVLSDFLKVFSQPEPLKGGKGFVEAALKRALGAEESEKVVEELKRGHREIEVLSQFESSELYQALANQQPSIIAAALSFADPKLAGGTIALFDKSMQIEVLLRIATFEVIDDETFQYLKDYLEEQYENISSSSKLRVGGSDKVSQILQVLGKEKSEEILGAIQEKDHDLAEQIESLMFRFDDLIKINDNGIQKILAAVDKKELALCFKKCSNAVKEKFTNNMSKNARELFLEEIEGLGKVLVTDVEKAQQNILALVKTLEEQGEIIIESSDDVYV